MRREPWFSNKLSLVVGSSRTGIPESLRLVGDLLWASSPPVDSGLDWVSGNLGSDRIPLLA